MSSCGNQGEKLGVKKLLVDGVEKSSVRIKARGHVAAWRGMALLALLNYRRCN